MIGCWRRALRRAYLSGESLQEMAIDAQVMMTVTRCWIRCTKEFGFGALMLLVASSACFAASPAAVSGVVRDAQGVAQMGAMVQVLAAGSVDVATAFTDMAGRYRIANLVPGSYQVRASAILFQPSTRRNLRLATGMLATVNLTLTMVADPATWLPAQRRKGDEPGDDWTWTLRSATNRPILRMLGSGEIVSVSSQAPEDLDHAAIQGRASVLGGNGGFGAGGLHSVVAANKVGEGGSDVIVRADVAAEAWTGHDPSTELDAGYERITTFAGSTRMVVSYASHPELIGAHNMAGMQVMRMTTARKMQLGEAVDVQAGGTVYAIHTTGTALTAQPFLQITIRPGQVWAIRYALATSREGQSFDGLDSIASDLPVTAVIDGTVRVESGRHQEFAVSRKVGSGLVHAAVYRDVIDHAGIAGVGRIDASELTASTNAVVDTATDRFRLLGAGYTSSGIAVSVSEPLTTSLWASFEYQLGSALAAQHAAGESLVEVSAGLQPENAEAVTAAVNGQVRRTGTRGSALYRWQTQSFVTAVDPYAAGSNRGLGFYVRQALRWGDRLPSGLEATIDVTNLLAEGYQPFLSADGRTLFLAESPRTIQGGFSFNF